MAQEEHRVTLLKTMPLGVHVLRQVSNRESEDLECWLAKQAHHTPEQPIAISGFPANQELRGGLFHTLLFNKKGDNAI